MKLTKKLISYLYRAISPDPESFLALRLRHGDSMTWVVSDGILSTVIPGGTGLTVNLADFTIRSLTNYLASQPGYEVAYAETGQLADLSAMVLVEGSGDQNVSNGDHIPGYTSLLWAYLESYAKELKDQGTQVDEALKQMNMLNSEGYWLDEWGGYYGIYRKSAEVDQIYANRIIAEVIRPRGNNVALASISSAVLGEKVIVKDVTEWGAATPQHNGVVSHNGSAYYNASSTPVYGLFDVDYAYNLESAVSITAYATLVAEAIEKYRDAGTHLRSLHLLSSELTDNATFNSADSAEINIHYGVYHNGIYNHNSNPSASNYYDGGEQFNAEIPFGSAVMTGIAYNGGTSVTETF